MIFTGKRLFVIALLWPLFYSGFAENPENVLIYDGVTIKLESDRQFIDLGERKQGSAISVHLKVKNTSDKVLLISNVRGSCGLSVPSWPRQPVEPGSESLIQLRYDSSRPGPINRNIIIHANTSTSTTVLTIHGNVVP